MQLSCCHLHLFKKASVSYLCSCPAVTYTCSRKPACPTCAVVLLSLTPVQESQRVLPVLCSCPAVTYTCSRTPVCPTCAVVLLSLTPVQESQRVLPVQLSCCHLHLFKNARVSYLCSCPAVTYTCSRKPACPTCAVVLLSLTPVQERLRVLPVQLSCCSSEPSMQSGVPSHMNTRSMQRSWSQTNWEVQYDTARTNKITHTGRGSKTKPKLTHRQRVKNQTKINTHW